MKIKFTKDAVATLCEVPEVVFPSGAIEDLAPASADRWIRRGVAVEVSDETPKPAKKASKKKAAKG